MWHALEQTSYQSIPQLSPHFDQPYQAGQGAFVLPKVPGLWSVSHQRGFTIAEIMWCIILILGAKYSGVRQSVNCECLYPSATGCLVSCHDVSCVGVLSLFWSSSFLDGVYSDWENYVIHLKLRFIFHKSISDSSSICLLTPCIMNMCIFLTGIACSHKEKRIHKR